jgi:hypothetical protein
VPQGVVRTAGQHFPITGAENAEPPNVVGWRGRLLHLLARAADFNAR